MTEKPSTKPPPPSPPRPPLKIRLLTAAVSAAYELSCRKNGTVNRRLLSCLDPPVSPNPSPVRHVATSDVTVDPSRNLYFRLFLPQLQNPADKIEKKEKEKEKEKLPTIVFFHGGGFAMLSPASWGYDAVCRRFARRLSAVVLSVNYRLAPEHKFPAPYDDGIDVLRYLDDAAAAAAVEEHADLSNVFLVGDSAGANIVHHVARRYLRSSRTRPWRRVKVRGLVLIQPFFGGEERTESEVRLAGAPLVSVERTDWCWRAFLPEGANRDHEAANVMKEDDLEDADEWPATMVVVGGWDPLQDWQRRYAEWLKKGRSRKGVRLVEYESAVHAFYILPGAKESGMVIEEMKGFMEGCSSESDRNE